MGKDQKLEGWGLGIFKACHICYAEKSRVPMCRVHSFLFLLYKTALVILAATSLRLGLVYSQLKFSQALHSPCIAVKPDCGRHHLREFIFEFAVLNAIETELPIGGKLIFFKLEIIEM